MRIQKLPILLTFALALPGAALAQTTPSSPGTSNAPAAGDQPTLSDKLNQTDGVIHPPPSGDTEMTQKPPPSASKTPVIPPQAVTPPGTPPDAPKPEAK